MALTKEDFIKQLRVKYPTYSNIDDNKLFDSVISKYPEYKTQISDLETPVVPQTTVSIQAPETTPQVSKMDVVK